MENSLKGKVAFITGAAHGQGRASALALAREGVHIIAFDIGQTLSYPGYAMGSKDDLSSLKQECTQLSVQCITAVGDVRLQGDISKAIGDAIKTFGRIDILFNNAGICAYGKAHELSEKEWDAMLDIN
jgi:NAD(P)-dependent dehydrogenase (short-subunit alcohol dehydrogenase family)